MATNTSRPQKDSDRIALTDDEQRALADRAGRALDGASFLGIDAEGDIHYFSMVGRSVAIFEHAGDLDPTTVALQRLDIPDTPTAWAEVITQKRGLWQDLRLPARITAELAVDQ